MVRGKSRSTNVADLQALDQEQDAHEITAEEIEQMLIPESLEQHKYTIKLWIE